MGKKKKQGGNARSNVEEQAGGAMKESFDQLSIQKSETHSQMLHRHKLELRELQAQMKSQDKATKTKTDKLAIKDRQSQQNQALSERHDAELVTMNDFTSAFSEEVEEMSKEDAESDNPLRVVAVEEDAPSPSQPIVSSKLAKAQRRRKKKTQSAEMARLTLRDAIDAQGPSSREIECNLLAKALAPDGLGIKEVPSDGNCLYHAMVDQLCQCGKMSFSTTAYQTLRDTAATYLRAHRDELEAFMVFDAPDSYDAYCDRVQYTTEWGGQVECRALAQALNVVIRVISADAPPLHMGGKGDRAASDTMALNVPCCILTYHRHYYALGEHYNSVVALER